jgi:reactive chlorine resistance protein C
MSTTSDIDKIDRAKTGISSIFEIAARADRGAVTVTRVGLIVVLLWIGGLKAFNYEAVGIVPLVANSPLMSFFYADPGQYKAHMNPEGALVPANIQWHQANHTYSFAYFLGTVIVLLAVLLCLHPWLPQLAAVGGFLVFLMSFVTLSFLITTPECWVPALGDVNHGFPFLSGAGRLVVKDSIMMGAALVVMADSAKASLDRRSGSVTARTRWIRLKG